MTEIKSDMTAAGNDFAWPAGETRNMTRLPIVWQRLVSAGKTCERCGATEAHLQTAVSKLRQALAR